MAAAAGVREIFFNRLLSTMAITHYSFNKIFYSKTVKDDDGGTIINLRLQIQRLAVTNEVRVFRKSSEHMKATTFGPRLFPKNLLSFVFHK